MKKKKGKILKVKRGYNPNCSSGLWAWSFIYLCPLIGGITGVASIIATIVLKKTHKVKKLVVEDFKSVEDETQENQI
jgi:hypothetical protein